jgi:HTH-type transcriptional regulator/antitoxin MqsA
MAKPETMIHPETGATLRRRKRLETITYMDQTRVVEVVGWFPEDDGDGVLVGMDAAPLSAALAAMKAEYASTVKLLAKHVRKAAGLSQKEASLLLTGSPNSFYKYENGEAQPSRPTLLLLKLLARDPKLIEQIKNRTALVETVQHDVWTIATAASPFRQMQSTSDAKHAPGHHVQRMRVFGRVPEQVQVTGASKESILPFPTIRRHGHGSEVISSSTQTFVAMGV